MIVGFKKSFFAVGEIVLLKNIKGLEEKLGLKCLIELCGPRM